MSSRLLSRRLIALAFASTLFAAPSFAQDDAKDYPNRSIKIIVTQAAGGTPDILCRLVTEELAKRIGERFVVENRPGGGNVVGTQAAARSAPDGYTLLWATEIGRAHV